MKLKRRQSDPDATRETLTKGFREIVRQVWALARHCDQPDGAVRCTVHVPLTLTFTVQTAEERDRLLGDVQAVRRGPEAMVKRLARRQAGRMASRVLWRWFR